MTRTGGSCTCGYAGCTCARDDCVNGWIEGVKFHNMQVFTGQLELKRNCYVDGAGVRVIDDGARPDMYEMRQVPEIIVNACSTCRPTFRDPHLRKSKPEAQRRRDHEREQQRSREIADDDDSLLDEPVHVRSSLPYRDDQ